MTEQEYKKILEDKAVRENLDRVVKENRLLRKVSKKVIRNTIRAIRVGSISVEIKLDPDTLGKLSNIQGRQIPTGEETGITTITLYWDGLLFRLVMNKIAAKYPFLEFSSGAYRDFVYVAWTFRDRK